jgi:hypothetical protein
MNNLTQLLKQESLASLRAQKAILRIYQWIDKHYPSEPPTTKSVLIKQCLSEITDRERIKK